MIVESLGSIGNRLVPVAENRRGSRMKNSIVKSTTANVVKVASEGGVALKIMHWWECDGIV